MDAAQLDFKEELTLERKRQQLQRELALELQKERLLNENVTITKTVCQSSFHCCLSLIFFCIFKFVSFFKKNMCVYG